MFDAVWLEKKTLEIIEEFSNSPTFNQRTHTLVMIQNIHPHVTNECINDKYYPLIEKLAFDKVPNIRFGSVKTLIALKSKLSLKNKEKAKLIFKKLEEDEDQDVVFYSEKATQEFA